MTDTRFRDTIKTLLAALGSKDPVQRLKARKSEKTRQRQREIGRLVLGLLTPRNPLLASRIETPGKKIMQEWGNA